MDITPAQIDTRRLIGAVDDVPVWELVTKGGRCVIVSLRKDGHAEYLGVGPHPGVARFVARKRTPKLRITVLEKSEQAVDPHGPIVRRYEGITEELVRAARRR